jgi:hypothetical protein
MSYFWENVEFLIGVNGPIFHLLISALSGGWLLSIGVQLLNAD